MATILTKKKDTTGAPAAGDLTNSAGGAELAVNTADKRLYTKDSGGNVVEVGTNPGAAVTFTAGTAAAPAITTSGDTNTGIFFPAADTIAFAEGGAEAMRIDSSGNVGINGAATGVTGYKVVEINGGAGGTILKLVNDGSGKTNSDGSWIYIGATGKSLVIQNQESDGTTSLFGTTQVFGSYNGASEYMRIDSSGNVGIGTSSPAYALQVSGTTNPIIAVTDTTTPVTTIIRALDDSGLVGTQTAHPIRIITDGTERMRIDSSGNVGIGTSSPADELSIYASNSTPRLRFTGASSAASGFQVGLVDSTNAVVTNTENGYLLFGTNNTERARITSGGDFIIAKTAATIGTVGIYNGADGLVQITRDSAEPLIMNRLTNDGTLVSFRQAGTEEGTISVSGATVSYNSFAGAHWTQLQQGRGYNPEIPRGTVMSSIGEMAEWKSVVWDEVIEHPAIPAVEAVEGKEAVLDEEGNVIEPAVEAVAAVEGKDAWTETIPHREAYFGNLAVGATFTEDGVTKTVVDDGNERLPKVKISDVVGDKAVYGVFQTYDEVQDMLVTALGAFVVRIAAGVTVQIGDLLESNGDGCAKVQDDDVIRSKTIGKVTSTVKTATYDDGSYTVPCVLYCG